MINLVERYVILDKIVLGIGNPGLQYAKTRHNVGFRILDCLAQKLGVSFSFSPFKAMVAEGHIAQCQYLLVKPMTYVNLSGESAQSILHWYKLQPTSLLVVVDDLNLPLAKIRVRQNGSSGGHHGLDSIIQNLNTDGFPRLRVGIDPPLESAAKHVLSKFSMEEEQALDRAMETARETVIAWLNGLELTVVHPPSARPNTLSS